MATVRATLSAEYAASTGERSLVKDFENIVRTPEFEDGALKLTRHDSPTRIKVIAAGSWHDVEFPQDFTEAGAPTAPEMAGARG